MSVGGGTGPLNNSIDAAIKAAQEAARRAAEAARKAAEEAAKRAAAADRAEAAAAARESAQGAANTEAASENRQEMLDAATKAQQEGNFGAAKMLRMEAQQANYGDAPWDAEDRAAMPPAARRLEEGVSYEDLQNDPQLARDIAALQNSDDPKVRALLEGSAKVWVKQALDEKLADAKGKDPKQVFAEFNNELAALGAQSGLSGVLGKNADAAVREAAIEVLESNPSMQELMDNPAKGQLLATLQKDSQYGDDVQRLVQGYAQASIDRNLQGKEKESGAKEAADAVTREMIAFAKATGLGDATKNATNAAFQASKGKFEDTAEKGRSLWDKAKGLAGDFFGAIGDVLGAGLDKLGDVAEGAFDVAGDLANVGANITAAGLDVVGADGAADFTRNAGRVADNVLDKTGELANDVGDVGATALQDGLSGVANQAMQAALGDEDPKYAGELDGVTGAITNRLGQGDSVYLGVSGGATVGVGVYGKMGVGGEAQLSRNDDGTISLTLEGEVSGEVGVSAKTGATGEVEAGDMGGEAGASADASAGVNAKATARVTLTFDPKNPADAARLKALIEPDVATVAGAVTNPLALAAIKGPALADAMAHNRTSITVGGQVGVTAEASASAGAGPLNAEVGVEASAVVGGSRTFNADGSTATTVFMNASASIEAGVGAGPASLEAGAGVKAAFGMTITRDAQGNVTGVSSERGVNASASVGVEVGGTASGGHGQTSKISEALTPAGVAEFNRRVAAGQNPISAYSAAREIPDGRTETKSTTTTDEFSIGAGGEVGVVGVQVGLKGRVTVGKSHTDEEVIRGRSQVDDQLNQDITNFND